MKSGLLIVVGIMTVLITISVFIPSVPVWLGGMIGIIVFLGAGIFSARLMNQKNENIS